MYIYLTTLKLMHHKLFMKELSAISIIQSCWNYFLQYSYATVIVPGYSVKWMTLTALLCDICNGRVYMVVVMN